MLFICLSEETSTETRQAKKTTIGSTLEFLTSKPLHFFLPEKEFPPMKRASYLRGKELTSPKISNIIPIL